MTDAIRHWWWFFLMVALAVTVIDVHLLRRVVSLSRQIATLSGITLTAAAGIAENTAAGEALGQTVDLVGALASKTAGLDPLTAAVVRRLLGQ